MIVLVTLLIQGSLIHLSAEGPLVTKGILDLRSWDFQKTPVVDLNGQWEFYWSELSIFPQSELSYFPVPEKWNGYKIGTEEVGALGYATYRITIQTPALNPGPALKIPAVGAAYVVYVNGKLIAHGGIPGKTAVEETPQYAPQLIYLDPGLETYELTILVSNHYHVDGGLWYGLRFGAVAALVGENQWGAMRDFFLLGSLLIMGFYHLGLFSFLRKDRSPLYFGLLCLVLSLRIPLYGEYVILQFFPSLPFDIHQKLGFLTFYLAPSLFYHFMRHLFPQEMNRIPVLVLDGVTAVFVISVLVTPYMVFGSILKGFQLVAITAGLGIIFSLSLALWRRRQGAGLFLLGFVALFAALINDILYANLIIQTGHMFPLGLISFIFVQAMVLTKNFAKAFQTVDKLSTTLLDTNISFKRFVPIEFLQRLERASITEVQLGDHTEAKMAVLFSDIRSFTELSERMTPEENFRFINSFLERMGPQIRKHGGFVDKYLGDGIMALFPGGAQEGVRAALDMLTALEEYNRHRASSNFTPIKIGIGLHLGNLMMGTIGEKERMDSTVIADAVNLSSRLEGLTKIYKCNLITTLEVLSVWPEDQPLAHRALGSVRIKGKELPMPVFEIYQGDEPALKAAKDTHRDEFHRAVELIQKREIPMAMEILKAIQRAVPGDTVTTALLLRLEKTQAPVKNYGAEILTV